MSSEIEQENTGTTVYVGLDCVKQFVDDMFKLYDSVKHQFYKNEPLKMTIEDNKHFEKSTKCYICNKCFTADTVKVKDHSHLTGNTNSFYNVVK